MKPSTSTVTLGLLLSFASSSGVALAADPTPSASALPRSVPQLVAESADSDDLTTTRPAQAPQPVQMTSVPPTVGEGISDTPAAPITPAAPLTVRTAGSNDLGITAKSVQVSQIELEPPPPVGGYQRPAATITYSPSDTLELDIDRNLAQLQHDSNPRLTAGFGFRWHEGTDGLNALSEIGMPVEGSFSPWYTGTARFAVLPVALDAGSVSTANLNLFGANPILIANGLAGISPRAQNAAGVGLLGGYSYGDFTGQFGTSPLGFPVTNLVGMAAYAPKFLDNNLAIRFEAMRQPVTDSVLSYAGTKASLAAANAITSGAFGTNGTWRNQRPARRLFSSLQDRQRRASRRHLGLLCRVQQEFEWIHLRPRRLFQSAQFRGRDLPDRVDRV